MSVTYGISAIKPLLHPEFRNGKPQLYSRMKVSKPHFDVDIAAIVAGEPMEIQEVCWIDCGLKCWREKFEKQWNPRNKLQTSKNRAQAPSKICCLVADLVTFARVGHR